jgi:hypothetical protein
LRLIRLREPQGVPRCPHRGFSPARRSTGFLSAAAVGGRPLPLRRAAVHVPGRRRPDGLRADACLGYGGDGPGRPRDATDADPSGPGHGVPNARLREDLAALDELTGTATVRTSGPSPPAPDPEEFHRLADRLGLWSATTWSPTDDDCLDVVFAPRADIEGRCVTGLFAPSPTSPTPPEQPPRAARLLTNTPSGNRFRQEPGRDRPHQIPASQECGPVALCQVRQGRGRTGWSLCFVFTGQSGETPVESGPVPPQIT